MKRLLFALISVAIMLLVSGSGSPLVHSHAFAQQQKIDPATITVFVTKTGEKYHRDGCRYLRQSRIPISLSKVPKPRNRSRPCFASGSITTRPTINCEHEWIRIPVPDLTIVPPSL